MSRIIRVWFQSLLVRGSRSYRRAAQSVPFFMSGSSGQFSGTDVRTGDPKGRFRLWREGSEQGGLHLTPVLS